MTRRNVMYSTSAVVIAMVLGGCSLSNDANRNLTSIINTAVSNLLVVSESSISVDYHKNKLLNSQSVSVTGSVTLADGVDFDSSFKKVCATIKSVLRGSGIEEGTVDIITSLGEKEKTSGELYKQGKDEPVNLSDVVIPKQDS